MEYDLESSFLFLESNLESNFLFLESNKSLICKTHGLK